MTKIIVTVDRAQKLKYPFGKPMFDEEIVRRDRQHTILSLMAMQSSREV